MIFLLRLPTRSGIHTHTLENEEAADAWSDDIAGWESDRSNSNQGHSSNTEEYEYGDNANTGTKRNNLIVTADEQKWLLEHESRHIALGDGLSPGPSLTSGNLNDENTNALCDKKRSFSHPDLRELELAMDQNTKMRRVKSETEFLVPVLGYKKKSSKIKKRKTRKQSISSCPVFVD